MNESLLIFHHNGTFIYVIYIIYKKWIDKSITQYSYRTNVTTDYIGNYLLHNLLFINFIQSCN